MKQMSNCKYQLATLLKDNLLGLLNKYQVHFTNPIYKLANYLYVQHTSNNSKRRSQWKWLSGGLKSKVPYLQQRLNAFFKNGCCWYYKTRFWSEEQIPSFVFSRTWVLTRNERIVQRTCRLIPRKSKRKFTRRKWSLYFSAVNIFTQNIQQHYWHLKFVSCVQVYFQMRVLSSRIVSLIRNIMMYLKSLKIAIAKLFLFII